MILSIERSRCKLENNITDYQEMMLYRLFKYACFLLFVAGLFSCQFFREPTVEDLIDSLPMYDDSDMVKWNCSMKGTGWENVHTIGELRKKLQDDNVDPHASWYTFIHTSLMDSVVCAWDEDYEAENLKTRLIMLDVMLKHGANPQHMTSQTIIHEKEYALFIKYGLNACKPIIYDDKYDIQYPLTHRNDFITAPIAEWLLKNGADPNQVELDTQRTYRFPDDRLTPLGMLRHKAHPHFHVVLKEYRTPEKTQKTREVLLKYGAKE